MVDPRGGRATAATLAVVVVAVDVSLAACTHGTAGHGGATAHSTAPMRAKAAQPQPPQAKTLLARVRPRDPAGQGRRRVVAELIAEVTVPERSDSAPTAAASALSIV